MKPINRFYFDSDGGLVELPDSDPVQLLALTLANAQMPLILPDPALQGEIGLGLFQMATQKAIEKGPQPSDFSRGPTLDELLKRSEWEKFVITENHDHIVQTRTALTNSRDFVIDSGWPTKVLRNERNRILGSIVVRPPQHELINFLNADCSEKDAQAHAIRLVESCSPLTADVMDLLLFLLRDPKNRLSARFTIDAILSARGLQKHQGGENARGEAYRGGYSKEQRQAVIDQIQLLSWVQVSYTNARVFGGKGFKVLKQGAATPLLGFSEMSVDKKPTKKDHEWRVEPSETVQEILAGSFRGYLPLQVMRYNPVKRAAEKAIARYLFARWRRLHEVGVLDRRKYSGDGLLVKDLLDVAGISVKRHHPKRAVERLSDALIQLMDDGLIRESHYPTVTEAHESVKLARGWAEKWLQERVYIQPTDDFLELLAIRYPASNYRKKKRSK
jgi:hypothetical protein